MNSAEDTAKETNADLDRRRSAETQFLLKELQRGQMDIRRTIATHVVEEDRKFDAIFSALTRMHTDTLSSIIERGPKFGQAKRSAKVLDADLWAMRLLTVVMYVCAGFGLMFYSSEAKLHDLKYLQAIMTMPHWVALAIGLAFLRAVGIRWGTSSQALRVALPTLGLWFWSTVFVSSTVFRPADGMSIMCVVPMVVEFWILIQAFRYGKGKSWNPSRRS